MSVNNQNYVLARWRAERAKEDPPFYTVRNSLIWLSVAGNVGWYRPEIASGRLVGIRSIALPPPDGSESEAMRATLEYAFKLINPQQRRKIEARMQQTSSANPCSH